ncbi:unnamed protein product [Paramecium primaurelia]|uniref:Uncharacterized protein n=1 Tax=Paramecium primaurelia TaxID=5886 RepID=A0A8S1PYH5_PARPR|nr:unnamed protein product [Paramecium primaurelia]
MKNELFSSKNPKISNKIFEGPIRAAFQSNAGEKDPDPLAIQEVQKAAVHFLQRVLEKSIKRSIEKQEDNLKLNIEDVMYQFRNQPKFLDLCARKIIYISRLHDMSKKKSYMNENAQDKEEGQEEREYEDDAKEIAQYAGLFN